MHAATHLNSCSYPSEFRQLPTISPFIAGTGFLNGRSEELLGRFVREYPGSDKDRNNICIATKLAPYPWRITSGNSYQAKPAHLPNTAHDELHMCY